MRSSALLFLRTTSVLLFLIAMPLLALPPFTQWLGTCLDSAWETAPIRLEFAMSGDAHPSATSHPVVDLTNSDVHRVAPLDTTAVTVARRSSAARSDSPNQSEVTLSPQEQNDRIALLRERLTGMGATHAKFESYGDGESKYKFTCEFPVKDSVYRRRFEQEDSSPLVAMQRVLVEVESWQRSGTRQLAAATTKARILR